MLYHTHSKHVPIGYGQLETDILLPIEYSIVFCIFFLLTTLSVLKYISQINGLQWYINKTKTSVSSENTLIVFSAASLIASVTIMTSASPSLWITLIFYLLKALIRKSINWTLLAVLRKNSFLSAVTCMISEIITLADTTIARLACSSPLADEV